MNYFLSRLDMIPARSIGEAIKKAKEILRKEDVTITAIPDGRIGSCTEIKICR